MRRNNHQSPSWKHSDRVWVIIVARISTEKQDERSLDDQIAYCRKRLEELTDRPVKIHVIKSQDSGEYLDRAELRQLEDLIESGDWDFVITEDLGRICRRSHALTICEMCEDAETRLIAINDHIDMAEEGWRLCSYFAAFRHEQYNRDTALRIQRSQKNRFLNGGALPRPFWGYLDWDKAKTDSELRKDPEAEELIRETFRRLEDGASFAEIADWFNDLGIPTGPSCRRKKWTTMSIQRLVRNPILKGIRIRNRLVSKRINKTGRRRAELAPQDEWLVREVPHLAYFESAYYDHVIHVVSERNKNIGRPANRDRLSRLGVPRKRTTWPLQHARCGICGHTMWKAGTHGERLACCSGALQYRCWNGMMIQVDNTQKWILGAVLDRIRQCTDFAKVVRERIEQARKENDLSEQRRLYERQITRHQNEVTNLTDAIVVGGDIPELVRQLQKARSALNEATYQLDRIKSQEHEAPRELPDAECLYQLVEETMRLVINEDDQASRLLCRILPRMTLYPVILCDGRAVEVQAEVEFDLSAAASALVGMPVDMPSEVVTVDLFDRPPYVEHAERLGTVEQRGETVVVTAKALGMSLTMAAWARRLYRRMQELGIQEPYMRVDMPPARGWRCRRHKHPRYRFEPQKNDPPPEPA